MVLPETQYRSDLDLTAGVLRLWPNVIAYGLSFAVIGIMWQNHHALFRLVGRIDRVTVLFNLMLLAGTAFIPFVTSTLGSYPTMHASTFLYGLVLSFCATGFNGMLAHLVREGAFYNGVSDAVAQTVRSYRVAWGTYVGAMLLALIAPTVSFAAYVALAIYFLIPRGIDADLRVANVS